MAYLPAEMSGAHQCNGAAYRSSPQSLPPPPAPPPSTPSASTFSAVLRSAPEPMHAVPPVSQRRTTSPVRLQLAATRTAFTFACAIWTAGPDATGVTLVPAHVPAAGGSLNATSTLDGSTYM